MRMATNELPMRIDTEGATARQQTDFGDASKCGAMGAEFFAMKQGADLAPLLKGLERDLCESPHWGYLVRGALTVGFADGTEEHPRAGDVFYWPPGHTVKATEDAEFVLFSPQHEHSPVIEHVKGRLEGK